MAGEKVPNHVNGNNNLSILEYFQVGIVLSLSTGIKI
jgi:hypothetical protein